jgi:hypothetical protein
MESHACRTQVNQGIDLIDTLERQQPLSDSNRVLRYGLNVQLT